MLQGWIEKIISVSLLSLGALLKCAGSKVEKNDLWNGIQERVPTWRCKFGYRVWRCSCNMDRGADYTNSLKDGPNNKTNQETHVSERRGDNISLLLSSQKGLQKCLLGRY